MESDGAKRLINTLGGTKQSTDMPSQKGTWKCDKSVLKLKANRELKKSDMATTKTGL